MWMGCSLLLTLSTMIFSWSKSLNHYVNLALVLWNSLLGEFRPARKAAQWNRHAEFIVLWDTRDDNSFNPQLGVAKTFTFGGMLLRNSVASLSGLNFCHCQFSWVDTFFDEHLDVMIPRLPSNYLLRMHNKQCPLLLLPWSGAMAIVLI